MYTKYTQKNKKKKKQTKTNDQKTTHRQQMVKRIIHTTHVLAHAAPLPCQIYALFYYYYLYYTEARTRAVYTAKKQKKKKQTKNKQKTEIRIFNIHTQHMRWHTNHIHTKVFFTSKNTLG